MKIIPESSKMVSRWLKDMYEHPVFNSTYVTFVVCKHAAFPRFHFHFSPMGKIMREFSPSPHPTFFQIRKFCFIERLHRNRSCMQKEAITTVSWPPQYDKLSTKTSSKQLKISWESSFCHRRSMNNFELVKRSQPRTTTHRIVV